MSRALIRCCCCSQERRGGVTASSATSLSSTDRKTPEPEQNSNSDLNFDTGRRIWAFVYESKQVVISTGRAITRAVMGSSMSSSSSEAEDVEPIGDRLGRLLDQKPCRISDMLKIIGILGESSPDEKLQLYQIGILKKICALIKETSNLEGNKSREGSGSSENKRKRNANVRKNSAINERGIGYGRGSTKSRWDIERTVEERIAQEEHLMWLLCALTTFLWGDSLKLNDSDVVHLDATNQPHLIQEVVDEIAHSSVLPLMEYHFNNDSVFDVSQHMDFYQALMELATGLAYIPGFVPYLVGPKDPDSKSIAKELIPRFRDTMNTYPASIRGQASPDFTLMDFIRRINDLSEILIECARRFEKSLPPEKRIKTAVLRKRESNDAMLMFRSLENLPVFPPDLLNPSINLDSVYAEILREYQIQTHKLLNETGKPIYGFTFKKELRNVNPFSASLRERTKRIAKELASMQNSLPLNASNSIFLCLDETRCDLLKVLVSGPDDTPYQNGLFEFDVFFPTGYPQSPPKCSFLTTGGGIVRFNPNLYNDGKICLSILGTWEGRPEEKWNPFCSLLQVLISIQGLIFVKHPYFNEPGFEKFQGTSKGEEYSRKYNLHIENATLAYAIFDQYRECPPYFKHAIKRHFWLKRQAVIQQAERWLHNVSLEISASGKDAIDGENSLVEGMFPHPGLQRQKVRKLIEEFRNMKNPLLPHERKCLCRLFLLA